MSMKSIIITTAMSLALSFCFQAEDGIRDLTVTGVQTCALPIYRVHRDADSRHMRHIDRPTGRQELNSRVVEVPKTRAPASVAPHEWASDGLRWGKVADRKSVV